MDVNGRLLRKLINDNYLYIISPSSSSSRGNDFRVLIDMVKNIASSPQTAKEKFADAITPDTPEPSKVFKDFDLAAFLSSLGLDPLQRVVLALGFKEHPREDLCTKGLNPPVLYRWDILLMGIGLEVLRQAYPLMLEILANPSKHPEMSPDGIAHMLRELLTPPTPGFSDESEVLKLSYAARSRYKHTSLPPQIINVTEPLEHMRQQESLATILQQFGPDRVRLPEHFQEVLRRKWNVQITEEEVADVLTLMAMSPNPSDWYSKNLVQALDMEGNLAQNFDWAVVIEHLDREDFVVDGPPGFYVITNAVHQGTQSLDFPLHQLWGGRWKCPRSQWSVLRAYIKADELDITKELGLRKVFSSEDFANANSALKLLVATFETQKLISYDAVDALLHLALDDDIPPDVRGAAQQELDRAAKFTPELVLCGALMTPQPWSSNLESIIESLFDIFFDGHSSHQMIFWRLWQMDKTLVAQRFVDAYIRNPLTITRILDISQELRCLSDLLEIRNATFVLDVASLAARREYLNLEKWLQEMITKYGGEFWGECYRFLRVKADAEYVASRENQKPTMVNLRVGPVHTFLTVLDSR